MNKRQRKKHDKKSGLWLLNKLYGAVASDFKHQVHETVSHLSAQIASTSLAWEPAHPDAVADFKEAVRKVFPRGDE